MKTIGKSGPRRARRLRQLNTIHPVPQDDVGQQQIGAPGAVALRSISASIDASATRTLWAEAFELAPQDRAHVGFVFDHEDRARHGGL